MVPAYLPSVDSVMCREVTCLVSCTLDELAQRMPAYSWAQVFAAVDRLNRQGTLRLSRTSRFGYVVSHHQPRRLSWNQVLSWPS